MVNRIREEEEITLYYLRMRICLEVFGAMSFAFLIVPTYPVVPISITYAKTALTQERNARLPKDY